MEITVSASLSPEEALKHYEEFQAEYPFLLPLTKSELRKADVRIVTAEGSDRKFMLAKVLCVQSESQGKQERRLSYGPFALGFNAFNLTNLTVDKGLDILVLTKAAAFYKSDCLLHVVTHRVSGDSNRSLVDLQNEVGERLFSIFKPARIHCAPFFDPFLVDLDHSKRLSLGYNEDHHATFRMIFSPPARLVERGKAKLVNSFLPHYPGAESTTDESLIPSKLYAIEIPGDQSIPCVLILTPPARASESEGWLLGVELTLNYSDYQRPSPQWLGIFTALHICWRSKVSFLHIITHGGPRKDDAFLNSTPFRQEFAESLGDMFQVPVAFGVLRRRGSSASPHEMNYFTLTLGLVEQSIN